MASTQITLSTERLDLAGWRPEDASAAVTIFGTEKVTRWLTPAMEPVKDEDGMRAVLDRWAEEDAQADPPVGHWAVRRRDDGVLLGSLTLDGCPRSGKTSSSLGSSPPVIGARGTRRRRPMRSRAGRSRARHTSSSP